MGKRKIPGPSWGEALPQTYIQEEVTYADIRGILLTTVQKYEHHEPEIEKTFFWRDEGVYYAIQFYSEDHTLEEGLPRNWRLISQDELEKILNSFKYPEQIQHVSYDGKGRSFPLYDEKDLQKAEKLLGFKVKLPLTLSNNKLKLTDSIMFQAGDQYADYFKYSLNAVENSYRAADDSQESNLTVYQSKLPLMNGSQLTLIRKLDMDGIGISAYKDHNHVFGGPYYNNGNIISETYYIWKQDDIYFTAYLDDNKLTRERQEELLKAFILAP